MLLYRNLYLTDDPSSEVYTYVQASQMKILGTIEAREMDIVFMDKEAFDAFAQNGFLYDLDALLEEGREEHPELRQKTAAHLVRNMEIREDNAKEVALDPSVEYQSVTVEYEMGIDLLSSPFFRDSGFTVLYDLDDSLGRSTHKYLLNISGGEGSDVNNRSFNRMLEEPSVKALNYFATCDLKKLFTATADKKTELELRDFTTDYLSMHFEKTYDSLSVLNNL